MNQEDYEGYKIKKAKYITITIIIVIAFVIFEIICNFDYFLKLVWNRENNGDNISVEMAKDILYGDGGIEVLNPEDTEFYIWTKEPSEQRDICVNLMKNQKRSLQEIKELEELEDILPEILFVLEETLSVEEVKGLERIVNDGGQVVFVTMPDNASLKETSLLKLMGIYENNGFTKHEGFRFIPNFFATDELMEVEELEIEMFDCKLDQRTKTYAYSLMKEEKHELDNEELPPTVWRKSYGEGKVYVINGNFHEFDCLGGVITGIIGLAVEDDIYPVINGYSVMINGLPYIDESYDEKIEELYSRDAMGLQQDILFPDLVSSYQQYQYFPTFFCSLGSYDGDMDSYIQKQITYMEKEIMSASGEIGLLYEGNAEESRAINYGTCLLDDGSYDIEKKVWESFDTIVTEKANDGDFIDYKNEAVMIPIVREEMFDEEKDRLKEISYATTNGMVSVLIDIVGILKEEESNWVDYTKQCESILASHNEYYKDFSRLTASQLAGRILAYQAAEPVIEKSENAINVQIENFVGEAYFILRTQKEITDIKNGSYIQMGHNAYMIKAEDAELKIQLEKETDLF